MRTAVLNKQPITSWSTRDWALQILKYAKLRHLESFNKYNMLGSASCRGELEINLGVTFDEDQREAAARAYERLKTAGSFRPTYSDKQQPESWCKLTPAGARVLETGYMDDLDEALAKLHPHLVDIRWGAWSALGTGQPHAASQAAHSARELIDQTLKAGAPDEHVKRQTWFQADKSSKSGVTRKMRMKALMERFKMNASDSDLRVADQAAELVLALDDKLKSMAHSRTEESTDEASTAIATAEMALKKILVRYKAQQK